MSQTRSKHKFPLIETKQVIIKDHTHLDNFYDELVKAGAEGAMIRHPESLYESKRYKKLLKYKPEFDAEAEIIGYKRGTGKYEGLLGSFEMKTQDGKNIFYVWYG